MQVFNVQLTWADSVPAVFLGSPVALISMGVLHHFLPGGALLLAGAVLGLAAGFGFIVAMNRA